jgi:hypothetical protein
MTLISLPSDVLSTLLESKELFSLSIMTMMFIWQVRTKTFVSGKKMELVKFFFWETRGRIEWMGEHANIFQFLWVLAFAKMLFWGAVTRQTHANLVLVNLANLTSLERVDLIILYK